MTEVSFEFIESGKRSFPSLLPSNSGLLSAANLLKVALALDLVRAAALATGIGQSSDAANTGAAIGTEVAAAALDATSLAKLAALIPGNFGRYAAGGNAGFLASNDTPYPNGMPVSALVGLAAADRAAVGDARDALSAAIATIGTGTDYSDVGARLGALVDSFLAACADPADAIRLLISLADFVPPALAAEGATGVALITAFKRAVATALARASAAYQPRSYDDAFATMATVATLLGDLATDAADWGDDASFDAIRALRVEVVSDLRRRGAQLARVRSFILPATIPALVAAQSLYADPTRADQLTIEAGARHPLFLPPAFQALAA